MERWHEFPWRFYWRFVKYAFFFAKKQKKPFFEISDFIVRLIPIGLFTGRIGNFINGELWGKTSDVAWGIVFPKVDNAIRHPTQLYEAFLEGVLLFIILNFFILGKQKSKVITAYFLILYSLFRFVVEFYRVPDLHIGYLAFNWVTMGQVLCLPMFILGLYILRFKKGS